MRWSQTLIPTLKEDPSDAECKSHKFMIRSGLIRKLASGVYTYLPLGLRALQKIQQIIREEMDKAGAVELLLPTLQPVELWERSGRIHSLGEDMIAFIDRHKKKMVLGPTHEEVITDLVALHINSYRKLPLTLYQIQTKFRDETRPRFGILRTREFIMKDAYSFDVNQEGLEKNYQAMYDAYCRIFSRCGLEYVAVEADTGIMGGSQSHEFMVVADKGEDSIVQCPACHYGASLDKATYDTKVLYDYQDEALEPLEQVHTPGQKTIDQVTAFLKVSADTMIKTIIYVADKQAIAVLIRGDFEINETKLKKHLKTSALTLADEECIKKSTSSPIGFSGPCGLTIPVIADYSVQGMKNAVTGANRGDFHSIHVNSPRDYAVREYADLRNVIENDPCPRCGKPLVVHNAIEIGHVFKLGTKYSSTLGAKYLDQEGKEQLMIMGCYGIGVNRIMATAIEQGADEKGIVWPKAISPYAGVIIPVNMQDPMLCAAAEDLYKSLLEKGVDMLLDDRDERPGVKFNDADLIGMPYQIIIGKQYGEKGLFEVKDRRTLEKRFMSQEEVKALFI